MTDNSENASEMRFKKLLELESCIRGIESGNSSEEELRRLRNITKKLINIESNGAIDPSKSLCKVFKAARDDPNAKRLSALLILRILKVHRALPENVEDPGIEQCAAKLVEDALPDFDKAYKFQEKKQTFEKINQMAQVHNLVTEILLPMKFLPVDMSDIVRQKNEIYRAIKKNQVKSYLKYYDYENIKNQISVLFSRAEELVGDRTEQYGAQLEDLKDLVSTNIEYANRAVSFYSKEFYLPLLESFREAVNKLDKESSKIFDCSLNPKKSTSYKAEKKYPLHETGREVKVTIPLTNSGPGIAYDVNAVVYCSDEGVAINEGLNLGEIRPGEFPFTLNVLIVEAVKEISFDVELSWNITGKAEPKVIAFKCNIQSQDPNIEWGSLTYMEPYSTEIAEGEEFVGRKQKVASLAKKLLKSRMQSSYITGQKRIGKTSLSLAAIEAVKAVDLGRDIETKYIEWGDVAHSDPQRSVEALGEEIASFFEQYLPESEKGKERLFQGSIAPLNVLVSTLRDQLPQKKFVIILDEFDEIPSQMYRYGSLAEAFFSNFRTLSSKSNMAFMLVGGEKMPFIMSAQGDQLNKFVGERLDFFSLTEEYDDYVELVRKPTDKILTWSEGTIEALFHLTNGHPFYTKLICSSIFITAVSERDADVSVRDIHRIVGDMVCRLDVNQFAHHWKDGISKIEEEEAVSLDRCRVLVAIGRAMRTKKELSIENIFKSHHSTKLSEHQVKMILDDFCRRDILEEAIGLYDFVVPLFGMWLEQTGVDRLIADRLGDELAASLENEEEKARISSSEIIELVSDWSAYRGREITAENTRAWFEQLDSLRDQRLIFNILENMRFVTEVEIRDKLELAHDRVRKVTPTVVTTKKSQKRNDIVVTYVDGEAKSGQYYASRYAEENKIAASCVISPVGFTNRVSELEASSNITVNGIVIVDDIIATGGSLSAAVKSFVEENRKFMDERSIKLVVVALFGTKKGIAKVGRMIETLGSDGLDLQIMEPLEERYFAFAEEPGIWSSKADFHKAKALCLELGTRIYSKAPLGYGGLGLMVVFPNTCPNNSLPILHSSSKEPHPWDPLFPRPVN